MVYVLTYDAFVLVASLHQYDITKGLLMFYLSTYLPGIIGHVQIQKRHPLKFFA